MLRKLNVPMAAMLVVLMLSALASAAEGEMRTWTDSTGQYRVQATFVELRDERVWLKKADGSSVGVPLDRLSAADQLWVARQTEAPARGMAAVSAEWLTFRGPNRDGRSPDQGLLNEWPEGGPKLLWKVTDIGNGHIYGNDGGVWKCLDLKTGEKKWSERAVGKGSVCWADGMLYVFSENDGQAALATCSPEGLEIKGKVKVDGEGPSWAHPVVIGSWLYLRHDKNLYCFDVKSR